MGLHSPIPLMFAFESAMLTRKSETMDVQKQDARCRSRIAHHLEEGMFGHRAQLHSVLHSKAYDSEEEENHLVPRFMESFHDPDDARMDRVQNYT